jgi:predicted HAD superfamily Cof-like phosphohydrolase
MQKATEDVRAFMIAMGQDAPDRPWAHPVTDELTALRARLMAEELAETLAAMAHGDLVEVADGLADLIYVAVGTAVAYGIPLPAVWDEVQRSNMAKCESCTECGGQGFTRHTEGGDSGTGTTYARCYPCKGTGRRVYKDEQGKVMKPEGWTPPDIALVLARSRGLAPGTVVYQFDDGRPPDVASIEEAIRGRATQTFREHLEIMDLVKAHRRGKLGNLEQVDGDGCKPIVDAYIRAGAAEAAGGDIPFDDLIEAGLQSASRGQLEAALARWDAAYRAAVPGAKHTGWWPPEDTVDAVSQLQDEDPLTEPVQFRMPDKADMADALHNLRASTDELIELVEVVTAEAGQPPTFDDLVSMARRLIEKTGVDADWTPEMTNAVGKLADLGR